MPNHITEAQIDTAMDVGDFVASCDEAFRLYGSGELTNLPRKESVILEGEDDVFRLELAGVWEGRLSGRKVIVERSDVSTGRLGERSATIEMTLEDDPAMIRVEAERITNRRTGAAAVLGAQYLSVSSETVAVVGTGRIAQSVALAADHLLRPKLIKITSRKAESRSSFVSENGHWLNAELVAVEGIAETVSDADVVITTVPTPEPILGLGMLRPDAHLSVVGGDPRTVQLDLDLLTDRQVIVDHPEQARQSGDFLRYADRLADIRFASFEGREAHIGDAALGRLSGDDGVGHVTYFTGMGIQDLHAAYTAYIKLNPGT
jgi:ornithine cyclodeaminase/alanine dehydrogenase-like protein (mu-crystallin family)